MLDGLKVLYLEDELLVAMDTAEYLETLGFESVAVAYRLESAHELMENTDFDLAILDINVDRGQTSIALGRELAQAGTRVIFASGNGGDAAKLRSDGFEFLDKPFSLPALADKLQTAAKAAQQSSAPLS
ncbi:response regulator [Roseobacter ponti]|uniref:Response regulator n=1 Tax=Roseobacter ponti TaxID=1891787 RepID=A0A858SQY3_9RHOB|nr:response regulator [Roseobacter ponti]QJF51134.1 response regulator [Roseobacter ponti]